MAQQCRNTAINWSNLLTPAAAVSEKSLIREMIKRLRAGDIISFAGGMPDPELFPYDTVQATLNQMLADPTGRAAVLNYGPSEGFQPLREWIVGHMESLGASLTTANILITSGGQQALDLTCRALLGPGDGVVVAAPTYLGALQVFKSYSANILSVATDSDGPEPEAFEHALTQKPKFAYLVSDFSNPSGETISADRRRTLLDLARRHGVPVVDDAAYQQLRFAGAEQAPLIAIDQDMSGAGHGTDGNVIHLGTFSKTLMPGMRVGWIAAPEALVQATVTLKQATDLHSPVLNQRVIYHLANEMFDAHVGVLRQKYGEKRDQMIASLREHMPDGVSYTEPEGGMFVWITLPEGLDSTELLDRSMDEAKVAFIPGSPFFAQEKDGRPFCRFSFSGPSIDNIRLGIQRFGQFMKGVL